MDNISYSYKVGVKEELINALRSVFGASYPDPEYASKIHITSEYPTDEVSYPLIVVRFNPSDVKRIGVGHYDMDDAGAGRVLHWRFVGSVTFQIFGLTSLDRDRVMAGLTNLFAFGQDIPEFQDFLNKISNQKFVTLILMTDSFAEGGESASAPAWNPQSNELLYSNSMTLQCWGEFFTSPSTGGLIELDEIDISAVIES